MKFYYITVRSITFAQRADQLLTGRGYRCAVQRTPRWMEEQGCGYCLRLWTQEPSEALNLLEQAEVPIRKVYIQRSDGQLELWQP